jgi:hypothetical protein
MAKMARGIDSRLFGPATWITTPPAERQNLTRTVMYAELGKPEAFFAIAEQALREDSTIRCR